MSYFYYSNTRRKSVKLPLADARRILDLASPRENEAQCLECGGKHADCSPEVTEHADDCPGVARFEEIYRIFAEALHK